MQCKGAKLVRVFILSSTSHELEAFRREGRKSSCDVCRESGARGEPNLAFGLVDGEASRGEGSDPEGPGLACQPGRGVVAVVVDVAEQDDTTSLSTQGAPEHGLAFMHAEAEGTGAGALALKQPVVHLEACPFAGSFVHPDRCGPSCPLLC